MQEIGALGDLRAYLTGQESVGLPQLCATGYQDAHPFVVDFTRDLT